MVGHGCSSFHELIAGQEPSRCLVVAELGVNHNGSAPRALRLVDEARRAGADAVKLQLFVPGELCSRRHRADELRMLESLCLSEQDHRAIVEHARAAGLSVFATVFDEPSLAQALRLGLPLLKLGSGEVTHAPLLAAAARSGLPIVLSTGASELHEVRCAVRTLRQSGAARLTLLHCVSAYPPPDQELNLRAITVLRDEFPDCLVGYSDHSLGSDAAAAAVALGACMIEKHLTLHCGDEGPDHAASADPAALAELVRAVRRVERMLGMEVKRRMPCEPVIGRSAVAARFLPEGHVLRAEDLAFRRPGRGVRPCDVQRLLGRRLARAIQDDELIETTDVCASERSGPERQPRTGAVGG
ncbi:MAG: N-acetylneuraminate synthase family protein [Phycisphaerales bacterium]|nr:N-acetylneuraminate synthase family protein [Phycisphaerales bacterium]